MFTTPAHVLNTTITGVHAQSFYQCWILAQNEHMAFDNRGEKELENPLFTIITLLSQSNGFAQPTWLRDAER